MAPGPHARPGPTMRDVAREAGVSKALVSIVFRGATGASEETRARVFAAAERIGYRGNRAASLLALTRTRQLGLVLDLHNGFHAELADVALAAADEAGYRLVLSPRTGRHDEERALVTALEFRCEALLLIGPGLPPERLSELVGATPVVAVGRDLAEPHIDVVRSADDRGMELVVDHLAGLGHRRIAHLDGGPGEIAADRRRGFERGAARHGLTGDVTIVDGGQAEADGRRAAEDLVRAGELPTAVAAFNDTAALGAIDVLTRAGLDIPEDVSVTGYDDTPVARLATIDLTSVAQDATRLARLAVETAIERLDGTPEGRRRLVFDPELRTRGSSAPPRTHPIHGNADAERSEPVGGASDAPCHGPSREGSAS